MGAARSVLVLVLLLAGCKEEWNTAQKPLEDTELDAAFFAGIDPHDERHRNADGAGDMVAVAQQVGLAARTPVLRIELEARDNVVDDGARNIDFVEQQSERVERRFAGRFARERLVGLRADMRDGGGGVVTRFHRAAMILPVGQVVGGAAPGVKQPDTFARDAVEQPACKGKAFRSARDAVVRKTVEGLGVIAPRFAHQRSSAFIAKIGSCGC